MFWTFCEIHNIMALDFVRLIFVGDASTLDELYKIYFETTPAIRSGVYKFTSTILRIDPAGKDLICSSTIQLAKMSCDLADYIIC